MQPHIDLYFYLHLVRADVELAEDVAEEILDLVPGVDTVGAIQHNHNVHVCRAPCHMWEFKNIWLAKAGMCSMFLCLNVCANMWLLCAVGAMVSLGSRSSLTEAQMPVLNIDVPHSWDQRGAHACQTHKNTYTSASVLQVKQSWENLQSILAVYIYKCLCSAHKACRWFLSYYQRVSTRRQK